MAQRDLSKIIMSSRVRLARNICQLPFPSRMEPEQAGMLINRVREATLSVEELKDSIFVNMASLDEIDRQILVEKHLISPELARAEGECAAVISRDEVISIMINEEDHLRIQVIKKNYDLEEAYRLCSTIDDKLDGILKFAFSPDYGYMTSCPTNVGTGLRASVMMHLPALVLSGYIRNVLEACSKLGIAVRGIYGEHSSASGNLFQISNQVSLGQNEEEIINGITNVSTRICQQESALREKMHGENRFSFEDKIWRSYGILTNARLLAVDELLKLLSDVRLGIDMGIIDNLTPDKLDRIIFLTGDASMQRQRGHGSSEEEINAGRAKIIRELIGS